MEDKLHLIMPMGGQGIRFFKDGFILPKPLIEIYNKPFFYWATKSITKFVDVKSITFVVLQEHVEKYEIDKIILQFFPSAVIVKIPNVLQGAVLTCKEGIKHLSKNAPILFNDCDHLFRSDKFNDFCKEGVFENVDGALLTFKSHSPKYSYLEYDEFKNVIRTVEKKVISEDAICGAYYFANKDIFERAVDHYLQKCTYSEYFISGVYNSLSDQGYTIKGFPVDFHIPFGTPEEFEMAQKSERYRELL